jgi:hypothetical protein
MSDIEEISDSPVSSMEIEHRINSNENNTSIISMELLQEDELENNDEIHNIENENIVENRNNDLTENENNTIALLNENIQVVNDENIPEVIAQPLNFMNSNIPITLEQYLQVQNTIRNIQTRGNNENEEQEREIEKYQICSCLPINKESSCVDKTYEICNCICCPLNLGCKICVYSTISICLFGAFIEKTFCPNFGKNIFGINDLVCTRCPVSILEKCCGNKLEENEG